MFFLVAGTPSSEASLTPKVAFDGATALGPTKSDNGSLADPRASRPAKYQQKAWGPSTNVPIACFIYIVLHCFKLYLLSLWHREGHDQRWMGHVDMLVTCFCLWLRPRGRPSPKSGGGTWSATVLFTYFLSPWSHPRLKLHPVEVAQVVEPFRKAFVPAPGGRSLSDQADPKLWHSMKDNL